MSNAEEYERWLDEQHDAAVEKEWNEQQGEILRNKLDSWEETNDHKPQG